MVLRKNFVYLCFVIPIVFLLAGCWDETGLDKKVFVIGIGLDKSEEKGKMNVTYLIANSELGSASGSGGTDEASTMTITVRGSDFISMRNSANSVIAREISYDLLRVIIVSEEFAKDEEFIRFIYSALKDREIKRDVQLVVSKEEVTKFFERNVPVFLTRPHKYYQNMIQRGIEIGLIPDSELHHFFRITEEDANLFLSAYATTEIKKKEDEFRVNENDAIAGDMKVGGKTNTAQFLGSAVFLEGQMIGSLTGIENRISMLLNDTSKVYDILTVFPDPSNEDYQLSVRLVKKQKTRVKMKLKESPPRIHVTLPLTMDIITDPAMNNPVDNIKEIKDIQSSIENYMEAEINKLIRKTQEEFQAEAFGWSLYARKEFSTLKEYMDFDWMKTYPDMKIEVDVHLTFGKFGRQPKIPGYKGIRD